MTTQKQFPYQLYAEYTLDELKRLTPQEKEYLSTLYLSIRNDSGIWRWYNGIWSGYTSENSPERFGDVSFHSYRTGYLGCTFSFFKPILDLPEGKKSLWENVLSSNVIAMIKMEPTNRQFRAHVLAQCGRGIPDECLTWESIRDWIEANIEQKIISKPKAHEQIMGTVAISETISGSCSYAEYRSGSRQYVITKAELIEQIQNEEPQNYYELESAIIELLKDKASNNPPETVNDGDTEYSDYESSDCETTDQSVQQRDILMRAALEMLGPDYEHLRP